VSVCKHYNPLSFSQFSFSHLENSSFCIIADLRNYFTCNQILFSMCEILKMISSPYYTVSAPQCLWVSLDRLKQIDVILTLSLRHLNSFYGSFFDLYSYEVVSSSDVRKNEAESIASIMAVDMKCQIYFMKTKNVNILLRVRSTDWNHL